MEYKLLSNGVGVLLSRGARVAEEVTAFSFENAPSGASAIFETKSYGTIYRFVENGGCTVDTDKLIGRVRVTVAVLGGEKRERWRCETLSVERKGDVVIILPGDEDVLAEIASVRIENDEIRKENDSLRQEIKKINERLERIMEGYDLT